MEVWLLNAAHMKVVPGRKTRVDLRRTPMPSFASGADDIGAGAT
jgi:hypothetical protein